jgi:hypothetical protein
MRRPLSFLSTGLIALAMMAATSLTTAAPAAAVTIAPTTTCNNALGNGGAVCEVTVVNTITPGGGSAVVTVRECTGSAGVPDATCTNTTTSLSEPVTAVTQCNDSINGGGGTLLCSITVTNNYVGLSPTVTGATVNQCVGSVTTGTVIACDPFPATTSGATITQCNGSGNGGGASLTCTATGTQSTGLAVLINQCNGSSNGGGTRTVCSASMSNVIATGGVESPSASTPNAAMPGNPPSEPGLLNAVLLGGLILLVGLSGVAVVKRGRGPFPTSVS